MPIEDALALINDEDQGVAVAVRRIAEHRPSLDGIVARLERGAG